MSSIGVDVSEGAVEIVQGGRVEGFELVSDAQEKLQAFPIMFFTPATGEALAQILCIEVVREV